MQGPEDSSSWVALSLDKEAWDDTELVSAYNKAIKYYNEKHGTGKEELTSASSPSLVPTRTTRLTPSNKKRKTSQRKPTPSSVPSSPLAPQPKETHQIQPSPSPDTSSSSSSVDSSLTNAATDSGDTAAWQQQYNSGYYYYPSAHSHHQLTPPSISTSTMPPVSSLAPSFPPFPIPSFPCNTTTTNERAGGDGGMRLDSQELGSLLMAWYYCGYFTGRYQTLREAASYPPQPPASTHANVTAAPTTTTTITSTGSKKRPFPSPSSDADHHP